MKILRSAIVIGLVVLAGAAPLLAQDDDDPSGWIYDEGLEFQTADGMFRLHISNRAQLRFTLNDLDGRSSEGSFDAARYQLNFAGRAFGEWAFRIQANFADGSETSEFLLEDAYTQFIRRRMAQLRVGQGKVFFGRQQLTESTDLQFISRSIASERFAHGRDVGLTLIGENSNDTYAYQVGVYNGSGINKDEDDNIDYMGAARLVVTPFGRYELGETDFSRPATSRLSVGVSAMANTIGTEDIAETRVSRGCLEAAYKIHGWNLAAEFYTESEDIELDIGGELDEQDTDGWYFQGGYLFESRFEVAVRYSEIEREAAEVDEQEFGVAGSYYFSGSRHKIQADFRRRDFDGGILDESTIDRDVIRVQLQLVF